MFYYQLFHKGVLDMRLKIFLSGIVSVSSFLIGLLFCQRSGEYWLQMFDSFSGTIPLLFINLCELIAVQFIYGTSK